MAGYRTLTIIKPDAFANGKAGLILALLENAKAIAHAPRLTIVLADGENLLARSHAQHFGADGREGAEDENVHEPTHGRSLSSPYR